MVEKWCVSPHVVISIYEGQINISGIKCDSFSAGSFITWEGKLDFVIGPVANITGMYPNIPSLLVP